MTHTLEQQNLWEHWASTFNWPMVNMQGCETVLFLECLSSSRTPQVPSQGGQVSV